MDTKQYITDALQTESKIDTVTVNPQLLSSTIEILIAAGNMLDQIKKHVFYGREYDTDKLIREFSNVIKSLDDLNPTIIETKEGNLNEEDTAFDPRVFHSIVGIVTEGVELLEALATPEFDKVNFIEELGDLNWYEAIGIDAVGSDFDTVLQTNINKLSKSKNARYKDGFTSEEAINRDVKAEREILENDV